MATTLNYVNFVAEQLRDFDGVDYRKMFGEYLFYRHNKPVLLVCDNTVFVKKVPELADLMQNAQEGLPYDGTKPHYILDIENHALTKSVLEILDRVTPIPKSRAKKIYQV